MREVLKESTRVLLMAQPKVTETVVLLDDVMALSSVLKMVHDLDLLMLLPKVTMTVPRKVHYQME